MGVSSDCFESLLPTNSHRTGFATGPTQYLHLGWFEFMTIPAEDQANRLSLRNALLHISPTAHKAPNPRLRARFRRG
jgi:hypothetical protein